MTKKQIRALRVRLKALKRMAKDAATNRIYHWLYAVDDDTRDSLTMIWDLNIEQIEIEIKYAEQLLQQVEATP